ncbi:MAG: FAD-dependent oxidoreductase [Candidatus Omnitrophica bacterium]|nr:FAD-dependent oxidoreductase [Candidatus Omnitrophota bacterium]MDD5430136.1 FAD-dependent oxidoreductase [Candidatus Omnitrophota bacterium]
MDLFRGEFIETIERTENVRSFRFITDKKIDFLPGQFAQVIFDHSDLGDQQLNKYLSFSSSPDKNYIEFTKRLSSSSFCEKLRNLKRADKVLFKAPLGKCVLKEEYKKIAFLIGGIGITPVVSILEYIADRKLDTDAVLFYSNRSESDTAFKKELDDFSYLRGNIKIFYTVTKCRPLDKNCFFGRISKELIANKLKDIEKRMFYIFGPPKMVEAMEKVCFELECSQGQIKTENFIGY